MTSLHPAHRLCCWLLLVIAVQCLAGTALLAALPLVALAGMPSLRRWFRLLRRMRWLLLSLLPILGWSVAGEPLWEMGAVPAPTVEGLQDGMTQLARLALVLAAVAILLETTPVAELMAGSRILLSPLRWIGADVDRAVVRLSLVLHYADELSVRDWRSLLVPDAPPGPETVRLRHVATCPADWLALLVASGVAAMACVA